MTDETATAAAPAAAANGQADAKPKASPKVHHTVPGPGAEPAAEGIVITGDKAPCGCESEGGKGAAGLGLLLCGVAAGLLYIGLDLIFRGGLTRLVAGPPAGDEDE